MTGYPALVLWGRSTSSNVQKVVWLCHELQCVPERISCGGVEGGLDTPEFAQLNPNRTIPVLKHGHLVMWESHAILRYLAATFAADLWYGAGPVERAPVDMWLDWFSGCLWPPIRTLIRDIPPEERAGSGPAEQARRGAQSALDLVDTALAKGGYIAGTRRPTIADISVMIGAGRAVALGCGLRTGPALTDWMNGMAARPGYRAATLDDPLRYVVT